MSLYYIGCDSPPTENGAATRLQCTYSSGAVAYSESNVIDLYGPSMTIADAHIVGLQLLAVWLTAFTGRKVVEMLRYS